MAVSSNSNTKLPCKRNTKSLHVLTPIRARLNLSCGRFKQFPAWSGMVRHGPEWNGPEWSGMVPIWRPPRPYFTQILAPFSAKPGQIWPTRRKAILTHRSIEAKPARPSCRSRRVSATPPKLSPYTVRRGQNCQGGLEKGPKMSEF